jgi:asparagine synthase (glutamine-hydrolysing)
MCGIAGMLRLNDRQVDAGRLARMIATLRHRGPDADGVHICGPIGLAHSRLSIIDLSGGAQPMSTVDGRYWITFNGEIFNYIELREELIAKGHSFATRSDTEVILNAYREYGVDCVKYFNGQWAFGIWDAVEQKLFLSRDRLGVRPLFYARTQDSFLFASEIKALFASAEISREIDPVGMDQTFTFWVPLPPRTVFRGISQLPPASSLTIQNGDIRLSQYWSLRYGADCELHSADETALMEQLRSLLSDATQIRLRADVPVGAYLSGGIDSTIITSLVHRVAGNRLRSFSITFAESEFDESEYQREASSFLGTQHSIVACSRTDIASIFPEIVRHAEQPLVRTAPAPMYLLSRLVHESGFKVVLTGEGADEIFGGYDIFKEAKIRRFWAQQPDSKRRALLLGRLYPYLSDMQKQPAAHLKNFFRVAAADLGSPFFSHLLRWGLTSRLKLLFSAELRSAIGTYDAIHEMEQGLPAGFRSWPHLAQAQYLETTYFLAGYLLSSQGDRMAMAHSVEGRYPFLDYRVVDFGMRLPDTLKMKVLNEKYLLKRTFEDSIPASIAHRTKQPYRAPDSKYFWDTEPPDYVMDVLSPCAIKQASIFDPQAVAALINKYKTRKAVSVRDDMAFMGVLSTQLLAEQFLNP